MTEDQLTWHIEFKSLSKTFGMKNQGTYKPDPTMTRAVIGPGMCGKDQPRVFKHFFQVKPQVEMRI